MRKLINDISIGFTLLVNDKDFVKQVGLGLVMFGSVLLVLNLLVG